MHVTKRTGALEPVSFDKVLHRIEALSKDLDVVSAHDIAQLVCGRIYEGVKTSELDELTAQLCFSKSTEHPEYGTLAARVTISNHQKNTPSSFREVVEQLHGARDVHGAHAPLVSDALLALVREHGDRIEAEIDYERDFLIDYFGFKTLERSYLTRLDNRVLERPQHMWMRVALGIWGAELDGAFIAYRLMSTRMFTHATPTLFNSGTRAPQLSSCFLAAVRGDSIDGMYETVKDMVKISKHAGGIGMHIHALRARGSYIRGTNGYSTGIVPYLRVLNEALRHVNQAGKRNGSGAIYLEPWHPDVFEFIALRRPSGAEEERCRDLFLALWTPDLFMKRVEANADWSLFCPDEAPGLSDVYGTEFEELYERYEREGRARRVVKAQELWMEILKSQIETGTPYISYKDSFNAKNNMANVGIIKSSNLCHEIAIPSTPDEYGVCNLASLVLPSFVKDGVFDHASLHEVVQFVTRSLDRVIDTTLYPVQQARASNLRHRPIGIGIQGLADVFMLLRLPFESEGAAALNREIAETIYHAAATASCAIARERKEKGLCDAGVADKRGPWSGAYESFPGSPASRAQLQPDLWGVAPSSARWDFARLRSDVLAHGMRNALLVALMPTASTSQIMGSVAEAFEPITSNIYSRRTLAGEFLVVNRYLVRDLLRLGLWSPKLKDRILAAGGSVQNLPEVPDDVKALYKTVWEIKQRTLINQSADRAPFVCHSQSLNLYVEDQPDLVNKMTTMHFYGWKKGLKTGLYYLRTRSVATTTKFTVDPELVAACRRDDPEGCVMCSA